MQRSFAPLLLGILTIISAEAAGKKTQQEYMVSHSPSPFTGLFLGINTGYIYASAHTRWVNNMPLDTFGFSGQYATKARGGSVGIHAILGHVFPSQFYVGGEVTGAYNFAKGRTQDDINYGLIFRYFLRDSYTAAVKAGFAADKILVYLKAGVALAGRKVENQFTHTFGILTAVRSSRKYIFGPTASIGFDIAVKEHVLCGLESSYTQYQSDHFNYPGGATYKMRTDTFDFKLKVTVKI